MRSLIASAATHFCVASANAQEMGGAVGANAAATFVCDKLNRMRKTKMAPQNYGAIRK
jgi:hypothetical protein